MQRPSQDSESPSASRHPPPCLRHVWRVRSVLHVFVHPCLQHWLNTPSLETVTLASNGYTDRFLLLFRDHTLRPEPSRSSCFEPFFAHAFSAPLVTSKLGPLIAKLLKSDPKCHPKATPKPFKWTWANPSKHMVFTVWATKRATKNGIGN